MNKITDIKSSEVPHSDLLADIEAFCAARDMPVSRFGSDAMGDPSFVFDLRNGRECRRATLDRARDWMRSSRNSAAPVQVGASK